MTYQIDVDSTHPIFVDAAETTKTLDEIYAAWAAGLPTSAIAYTSVTGDDSATAIEVPSVWPGGGAKMVVSWECGLEIGAYPTASVPAMQQIALTDVSRYYTIDLGRRFALVFHPTGVDSGINGMSGYYSPLISVFRATFNRVGENIQIVCRVVKDSHFEVAVKNTVQNSGIPLQCFVLDGVSEVSKVVIPPVSVGTTQIITCLVSGGNVQGVITGADGLPAKRKIHVYQREDGELRGSGQSADDGTYSIAVRAKLGTQVYVVALDDDDMPLLNAVIADRITLE